MFFKVDLRDVGNLSADRFICRMDVFGFATSLLK